MGERWASSRGEGKAHFDSPTSVTLRGREDDRGKGEKRIDVPVNGKIAFARVL